MTAKYSILFKKINSTLDIFGVTSYDTEKSVQRTFVRFYLIKKIVRKLN